ncbi:PAS domain-containing protein [Phenylobacterium sp.]|uniref:PAS domain-containing protein n=1 Tax=Phenylobacterium sp. TaxID=1871053 RepID=UPI0025D4BBE8|nr:PAS domain-containing protein [Phenylobacterium sp.]
MGATVTDRLAVGAPTIDFARLFRVLPSPYMILNRDLRYVEVNDAYCTVLERRREDLIGAYLFDAFPDPGESGRRLKASLQRVLETGLTDSLPLIPYAIERPAARGGGGSRCATGRPCMRRCWIRPAAASSSCRTPSM